MASCGRSFSNGLQIVSDTISKGLENYFYRHGKWVASHPKITIICSLLWVAICSIGIVKFYQENNMVKLWIPPNSDFAHNNGWLWENFPPDLRFNSIIFEHEDNILVPEVIQQLYQIHKNVLNIQTSNGKHWPDLCIQLPVVDLDSDQMPSKPESRRKRAVADKPQPVNDDFFADFGGDAFGSMEEPVADDFAAIKSGAGIGRAFDPSVVFYPDEYCPIVEQMPLACFETSLLEMFAIRGKFTEESEAAIENLTQEELIFKLNTIDKSGVFLHQRDYSKYLGQVERNSTGHIVKAKATFIRWFGKANVTEIKQIQGRNGMDQQPVDTTTLEFEELLQASLEDKCDYPEGLSSRANVQRSYGDISTGAIWDDVVFLTIGYLMIYAYVQSMLGKFNRVEQRAFLGALGIASCAISILVAMGICSLFGLGYGPMHSIIPCLLVGLGVDDMFVIVQAFNNAENSDKEKGIVRDLPERIGRALKHAGVGITITSITDIIVFGVGGTTVLPSLKSYSLYTATGIAAVYILQSTFFVACLTLDQKRIDNKRDGTCCWKVYGDSWKPNRFSQRSFMEEAFDMIGTFLTYPIVKVGVVAITIGLCVLGCYGTTLLEVEFRYVEFLPQDTNLYKWFHLHNTYFPGDGEMGTVYFSEMDLYKEFPKIKSLVEKFQNRTDIIFSVDSWYHDFEDYLNNNFLDPQHPLPNHPISEVMFHEKLTQFLFSPSGAKHMNKFKFENEIKCGVPSSKVMLSTMEFVHKKFSSSKEHIPAMNWVKNTIKESQFPGIAFAMAQSYSRWEIDEVISEELFRNLFLAIICVSLTTLVLLANVGSCLIVILCVILSLVDVGGAMYLWGLTIDIVASTNIIISVGLCVDFSAHVAHFFMIQSGTRDERMRSTLKKIGPAVFNGGFSTLIAVLMLANSKSHVFVSYFKVFFLMIVFGLFHGLIFLPVILSWIGSKPYKTAESEKDDALESKHKMSVKMEINHNLENDPETEKRLLESHYDFKEAIPAAKESKV